MIYPKLIKINNTRILGFKIKIAKGQVKIKDFLFLIKIIQGLRNQRTLINLLFNKLNKSTDPPFLIMVEIKPNKANPHLFQS